jgi:hypothetical protein
MLWPEACFGAMKSGPIQLTAPSGRDQDARMGGGPSTEVVDVFHSR